MATPPTAAVRQVGLLVLEADPGNSGALKQILDSEGWRVRIVGDLQLLHMELKTGEYSLVIANIEMVGLDTPTFHVLKELAAVAPEEGGRIRVLYVVGELAGSQFVPALEKAKVPYAVRPFHLHDFLEKVSDLLVEVKAIEGPLRMTRYEFGEARKKKKQTSRTTSMFASRDSYSYTEEEIAEYEREEAEASKTRRIKPRTNLGDPRR
ncbi:MAG TPA: response regulator [Candidatus Acidoferrales bacterium]|jgi:DNA-binding response OmpR family regulator|nr:response regulator [Candidatus Acidoferrales bacterium]